MKKIISAIVWFIKNSYTYWIKFLTIIGDIKVYKTPCFILYNNEEFDYKVRGYMIREIEEKIEPGDIILRKYCHYLDGFLIPGDYSHSGIYVGNNNVIHAIAEGVIETDIIDYCQADAILVLRPIKGQDEAIAFAKQTIGSPYDFKFNSEDSSEFYCHEFTQACYKNSIKIEPIQPKFFGKTLSFIKPKYLADCFINNENFNKVIEFNPKTYCS